MNPFDIFTNNAQKQAAGAQTGGIDQGLADLSNRFAQGRNALQTDYMSGLQPFLSNYGNASQGTTALGNALGLNGATGNAAAIAAFQNNPGLQFAQQQIQNTVDANQARSGQLASGKTNLDLANYESGLLNQNWNSYVNALQPYLGAAGNAASGIGSLYSNLGNQQNASDMGEGNAYYGGDTSIGNANANAALGNLSGAANLWGLGTGLLSLGVSGSGTLGGNLFNKFMQ